MATPEEMFRTAKFGGYDKDDVEQEIQRLNDAAMVEKNELKGKLDQANAKIRAQAQELEVRSAKIKELQDALIAKDTELQNVEKEVKDKYQSYVDNYDTIGSLIYEAKIRAKQVDRETEAQRQRILAEANAEAQKVKDNAQAECKQILEDTQKKIDEKNREGKLQYAAIQEELSHVIDTFNQVQKSFMNSYRDIQNIVNEEPASSFTQSGDKDFESRPDTDAAAPDDEFAAGNTEEPEGPDDDFDDSSDPIIRRFAKRNAIDTDFMARNFGLKNPAGTGTQRKSDAAGPAAGAGTEAADPAAGAAPSPSVNIQDINTRTPAGRKTIDSMVTGLNFGPSDFEGLDGE
ncbi:MAG: hypothetical protein SOH80_01875 [Eubacteriales bacterium]|jgi:cell division septum initiation protein DivIVA